MYYFHSGWEKQYVVVENDDNTGVICLIYCVALSGFHKGNCQRHYNTHHTELKKTYPADADVRKSCHLNNNIEKNFLPPTVLLMNCLWKYPLLRLISLYSMGWQL